MDKLRFKSFEWPQNPEKLHIEHRTEPHFVKADSGRYVWSGMHEPRCIITGSGEFTGPVACEGVYALGELLADTNGGILHLPDGREMQAYLTDFRYSQDARQMYVAYEFTFRVTNQNGILPH